MAKREIKTNKIEVQQPTGSTDDLLVLRDSSGSAVYTIDSAGTPSGGSGANTALSNLITTSINQTLIPSAANTRDIGTTTVYWKDIFAQQVIGGTDLNLKTQNKSAGPTGLIYMATGAATASGNTGQFVIETGGSTAAASGNVTISSGTGATTSGNVTLLSGSASTRGKIILDGLTIEPKASIIPNATQTYNIGASAFTFTNAFLRTIQFYSGGTARGFLDGDNSTSPSGAGLELSLSTASASQDLGIFTASSGGLTGSLYLETGNNTSVGNASGSARVSTGNITNAANASNTGTITIISGNTAGAGSSGAIVLQTGTGTTRGKLKFVDGSEGTTGHVWTSTDTLGNGAWQAAGGASPAGADTQIQYNNSGAFGADSDFTWDQSTNIMNAGFTAIHKSLSNAYWGLSIPTIVGTGLGVGGVTSGNFPAWAISSAASAATNGVSAIVINTGNATGTGANAQGGGFYVDLGSTSDNSAPAADVQLKAGDHVGTNIGGYLNLYSGNSTSGDSGPITIRSGTASGTSGDITLETGTGATRGEVLIDASETKVTGGLTVGSSGNSIGTMLTGTGSITVPAILAGEHADVGNITVTGLADGDFVYVTPPNAAFEDGMMYSCYVSATNTLTINVFNGSTTTFTGSTQNWRYFVVKAG